MRRSILAVVLALGLVVPATLVAQPKPGPSASAKAPKPPPSSSAKAPPAGSASAMPPGHPPVGDEMPQGHPPVGDDMPPGHPPVGDDDDDDEPPARDPHATDPRFFQPPEDVVDDDPTLPAGTIAIAVRDAKDKPIGGVPITLGILRNSVAKGESRERVAREADGEGLLRFDHLDVGTGVAYRVSSFRGEANYALPPFSLGDKAGKRAVLHVYEATSSLDNLFVGMQAVVYMSLREDSIQIEQLVTVYNLSPVAWTPNDVVIRLPHGFKAFNKQESMEDTRVDELKDEGASLRGTYAPGRHDIQFRYQVPLANDERQTLEYKLPPRVAQMRVMAEASKAMGLEVPEFPPAQRSTNREGKRLLVTQKQVSRDEGGIDTLSITLTGLPTPGPGRWVALGVAALALLAGAAFIFGTRDDLELDAGRREELVEAREALLREIVALERAKRSGSVGPRTYERVRGSLLDALARIVTMLEGTRAARREASPERRRRERVARADGDS